ncbi:MAG: LacI family transcriptional regulator [Bacilli bacterium]|nr:LacI family transcriptional regulator [Bacilli bacterium]
MSKATMKHVATEAGVSTATISRVLTGNGFVSDEVTTRVQAAIAKLNYQPNAVARSLKNDKTLTIGVIIPDISNPFFMSILRGIEDVVRPKGYHLIFCSSDEDPQKEGELLQLLHEKRVDAVVLATSGRNEDLIGRLSHSGLRIILLDRKVAEPKLELDSVTEDNESGAYKLTKMLLSQGHERIGVINGFLNTSTGNDRNAGYTKAMHEAGLVTMESLVYNGNFSVEGGIQAVRHFMQLALKPTAILSFNNNMSFGVLLELHRMGLRTPQDMMLASYGEVEAALLLPDSGIIYVQQTPYEMGLSTGQLLLRRLDIKNVDPIPEPILFEPEVKKI